MNILRKYFSFLIDDVYPLYFILLLSFNLSGYISKDFNVYKWYYENKIINVVENIVFEEIKYKKLYQKKEYGSLDIEWKNFLKNKELKPGYILNNNGYHLPKSILRTKKAVCTDYSILSYYYFGDYITDGLNNFYVFNRLMAFTFYNHPLGYGHSFAIWSGINNEFDIVISNDFVIRLPKDKIKNGDFLFGGNCIPKDIWVFKIIDDGLIMDYIMRYKL